MPRHLQRKWSIIREPLKGLWWFMMVYDGLKLWTLEFINMLFIQFETIWIQLYKLKLLELHEACFSCLNYISRLREQPNACSAREGRVPSNRLGWMVFFCVCFCLTSKHAEHSQVVIIKVGARATTISTMKQELTLYNCRGNRFIVTKIHRKSTSGAINAVLP